MMVSVYSCSIKIIVDKQLTLSIIILGQSYMHLFLPYLKYVKHQSFNLSDVLYCMGLVTFRSLSPTPEASPDFQIHNKACLHIRAHSYASVLGRTHLKGESLV
jgi:hypothetical protein